MAAVTEIGPMGLARRSGLYGHVEPRARRRSAIQAWTVERSGPLSTIDTPRCSRTAVTRRNSSSAPERRTSSSRRACVYRDQHAESLKACARALRRKALYEHFGRQGNEDFETFAGYVDTYEDDIPEAREGPKNVNGTTRFRRRIFARRAQLG